MALSDAHCTGLHPINKDFPIQYRVAFSYVCNGGCFELSIGLDLVYTGLFQQITFIITYNEYLSESSRLSLLETILYVSKACFPWGIQEPTGTTQCPKTSLAEG